MIRQGEQTDTFLPEEARRVLLPWWYKTPDSGNSKGSGSTPDTDSGAGTGSDSTSEVSSTVDTTSGDSFVQTLNGSTEIPSTEIPKWAIPVWERPWCDPITVCGETDPPQCYLRPPEGCLGSDKPESWIPLPEDSTPELNSL